MAMKLGWTIIVHLLGLGCIGSAILIIAMLGQGNFEWTGWFAIAFYWMLAVGFAMGWLRLVGQPLTVIALGFYVMASLLLMGVGFSAKIGQPTLLLAFAPMATAFAGRIILEIIWKLAGKKKAEPKPESRKPASQRSATPKPASAAQPRRTVHDTLFQPVESKDPPA